LYSGGYEDYSLPRRNALYSDIISVSEEPTVSFLVKTPEIIGSSETFNKYLPDYRALRTRSE
jgi:hypothetical protein